MELYLVIIALILDAISICGMHLNASGKLRSSFWVWLLANVSWIIYDLIVGEYVQAGLFAVYAIQCIFGLVRRRSTKP